MDHNDCRIEGFMTTNDGDILRVVGNYAPMRQVSGHVLLNHAAVCLKIFGKPLSGTQAQQHFVQRVALLLPGQSNPLLWLEAGLFFCVFLANSAQDAIASLEALFLFVYKNKMKPHRLASISKHTHTRLTTLSSHTSRDIRYLKHFLMLFAVRC